MKKVFTVGLMGKKHRSIKIAAKYDSIYSVKTMG